MSKSASYYMDELEKRDDKIAELVEALKDAHPYITNDGLRAKIGNLIAELS